MSKLIITYPHPEGLSPNAQAILQLKNRNQEFEQLLENNATPLDELYNKKYILKYPTRNEEGKLELSSIIWSNLRSPEGSIEELIDKCTEYIRSKFKPLGSGLIGDKNKVKDNLKWFFEQYPEYSDYEIVARATDRYINTIRQKGGLYRNAHYFIRKYDLHDRGTPTSDLSTFCEEIDSISPTTVNFL